DGSWMSIFDLELMDRNSFPFEEGKIQINPNREFQILPQAIGGTVNMVSGSESSIERLQKKYPEIQVESMEGAAAAYVSKQFNIPLIQVRGISNYVEPRNKSNWQLEKAIDAVGKVVLEMVEAMATT
ncbi:MAG: futalosine hydrolase, partial [Saprospiraceae bacterium]|nr:futalosine hydrolase [Saprospiraceae bacterium]